MKITLTDRELATVLAGVRMWQRLGFTNPGPEWPIANNAGTIEELQPWEMDELCERINAGNVADYERIGA